MIIALAIGTLAIVIVAANIARGRVDKSKGDPERSAFTKEHGDAPRENRPGTDH